MPRILTNNYGLPQPFVRAVANDKYRSRGNISITGLIDSARTRLLKRVHQYEEDVADTVWSIFGSAVHSIIERSAENHEDALCEIEMMMKIGEWDVSGTTDMYQKSIKTVTDWKVTSVWKVLKGLSDTDSWVKQTNCYAAMLQSPDCVKVIDGVETKEVFEVENIEIICILKDWKKRESLYNKDYPPTPVIRIKVPMFSKEGMISYMHKRVAHHLAEEQKFYLEVENPEDKFNEKKLSLCTAEERWTIPPVWKMKTAARKNSVKNFNVDSKAAEEEAIAYHAANLSKYPDLKIEKVSGEDKRCSEYCPVNVHCSYWQVVKSNYEK